MWREAVLDREEEILIEEAKRLKARWKREAEADVASAPEEQSSTD